MLLLADRFDRLMLIVLINLFYNLVLLFGCYVCFVWICVDLVVLLVFVV